MKILLINPPATNMVETNNPSFVEEESGCYPPLGLLYIAAYLLQYADHQVKVIDAQVDNLSFSQISEQVKIYAPDLVGIQAVTFLFIDCLRVAKAVKEVNPQIHVTLGGPHVYIFPQETIKNKHVDSLIVGEGEKAFMQLARALAGGTPLAKIPGLVFKKDKLIFSNCPVELTTNLDELPFPARTLVPYKKYRSLISKEKVITTLMSSRGCPFKCTYCDRPHLGKQYRYRSADNILLEIKQCLSLGISEIMFFDDIFTCHRARVVEICRKIIEGKLPIQWSIRARVDTVDQEMLELLKEAGCIRISFGVEAGTQKTLNRLNKKITLEQARRAIKMAKATGIVTLADFMIGCPGESAAEVYQTIAFALELDPDYAQFTITTPYPATELYQQGLGQGVLKEDYWQKFAECPTNNFKPKFWEENLSRNELIKLRQKAYRAFYLRPKYIIKTLYHISNFNEMAKKAKAAFKLLLHSRMQKIK